MQKPLLQALWFCVLAFLLAASAASALYASKESPPAVTPRSTAPETPEIVREGGFATVRLPDGTLVKARVEDVILDPRGRPVQIASKTVVNGPG